MLASKVEARDAAHFYGAQGSPHDENDLAPNVRSVQVEKPQYN